MLRALGSVLQIQLRRLRSSRIAFYGWTGIPQAYQGSPASVLRTWRSAGLEPGAGGSTVAIRGLELRGHEPP
jgi:hypothetical protein